MDIKIDKIKRSSRRTIGFCVTKEGGLVVRAPYLVSRGEIERLVADKRGWIEKKQRLMRDRMDSKNSKGFEEGEDFFWLGKAYPLRIVEDEPVPLVFINDRFELSRYCHGNARELFVDWYKKQAKQFISERVVYYSDLMEAKYEKIRIGDAKTRWGSCSGRGNLNFSWRLVMAEPEIIDYVVVHELAHIEHRNHQKRFWGKVERYIIDYKKWRAKLKKFEDLAFSL